MTSKITNQSIERFLIQNRILVHVAFWLVYYVIFSLLWAKDGNYYESFALEFVLMPVRIFASYLTLYYFIPRLLLREKILEFGVAYLLALVVAGFLQRIFSYFFYDLIFTSGEVVLITMGGIVRAMVLVNSTVLFLSAIKMFQHWKIEKNRNNEFKGVMLTIRSDKRNYRVKSSDIQYVEGLGNYVTFYFESRKPLISYLSLKEVEGMLPENFTRIHKSFVVNKECVESYTAENVEVNGRVLPVGKSVQLDI